MGALKLFTLLSKALQSTGNTVQDIRLTDDGVIAELNIEGQDCIVFVTPKHLITKETQDFQTEEFY